jgi:hypothetical protein
MASSPDAGVRRGLILFFVLFSALYASFGMVSPFLPVVVERRHGAFQLGRPLGMPLWASSGVGRAG